jgi:hypothetical protein
MTRCGRIDDISVVNHYLTTEHRVVADRTVKECLTVQAGLNRSAVTEESSVSEKEQS